MSAHWDLPHEDNTAWPTAAPRRRRVRLSLAVIAAAVVVGGGIGGAITASSTSNPEQEQGAAPGSQPKAAGGATTATVASSHGRGTTSTSLAPSPNPTSVVSAEPRTLSLPPSSPPQPPPFTYLSEQVGCSPQKQAEVDGAWQYIAPGEVRAGDAVELALRNKYGNFDPVQAEMPVLARVYMPDGTSRLARATVRSDTQAVVTWPGDFPGAAALYSSGTYTVVWSVGDGSERFIACTGFTAH